MNRASPFLLILKVAQRGSVYPKPTVLFILLTTYPVESWNASLPPRFRNTSTRGSHALTNALQVGCWIWKSVVKWGILRLSIKCNMWKIFALLWKLVLVTISWTLIPQYLHFPLSSNFLKRKENTSQFFRIQFKITALSLHCYLHFSFWLFFCFVLEGRETRNEE